jgi:ABC-type nitrate/sulfonate/bicarbonate transport system permease component
LLKVEDMYAALGAIALLGGGLLWMLGRFRRRLVPWLPDVTGA